MKIAWTRLALEDLNHAYDYVAVESPAASVYIIERIEKALRYLSTFPEIGRKGRVEGTRELVITGTPFIVPYRINGKKIEILAVMHGSRRWPNFF